MRVVVDASVIVKWVLPDPAREPDLDEARLLFDAIVRGDAVPFQPPHWLAEVGAVIARLQPEVARTAVELLHSMDLPVHGELEVYSRAATLAIELEHHLFDTLYHALALEHDALLVTADDTYYRKARRFGSIRRLRAIRSILTP